MKKLFNMLALMLPMLLVSGSLLAQDCQALFFPEVNPQNPLQVQFTDWSEAGGDIASWAWDFGDGATSADQNPSHTYSEPGTYTVSLSIASSTGCQSTMEVVLPLDTTGCNCPTVYDPVCVAGPGGEIYHFPNECEANCAGFTEDDFVDCAPDTTMNCQAAMTYQVDGLTVSFTDFSFASTAIESWTWDFGDGQTGSGANPTHEYDTPGNYEVSLTITTAGGCSSTTDANLTLVDCNCSTEYDPVCVQDTGFCGNGYIEFPNECMALCAGFTAADFVDCDGDTTEYCEAFFGYENDLNNDLTVHFIDYSFTMSNEVTWTWDFGDGTGSNEQNPTHTYDSTGVYNVTLTISTPNCSGSFSLEVWLDSWTSPCNCTDEYNPVCVEIDSGVVLPFWNACYATCEGFTNFVDCDLPTPNDCEAFFGYYQDFMDNDLTVNFEDYSYSTGTITSWAWDFGDGSNSTDQNPEHTFAEAGQYPVTLTITSDSCTNSVTIDVFVGDFTFPDCQAFFWPFPADSANDLTFQFLDLSLGNPTAWAWDFGDGTTSTEQNPTHTFANDGTYTVSLSITSDSCQSTYDLVMNSDDYMMVSTPNPVSGLQALFTPVMDDVTNSVYFKNQSTSATPITQITYDFGDGNKAEAANIQHLFLEKKAYNVTMQVTNSLGEVSNFMGTIDLATKQFTGSTSGTSIVLGNQELADTRFDLQLAPNPVSSQLDITYEATVAGKYNMSIESVTGKTLYTQTNLGVKGQNKVSVNVQDFPQGVYLLKLQVANSVQTYKFVKE